MPAYGPVGCGAEEPVPSRADDCEAEDAEVALTGTRVLSTLALAALLGAAGLLVCSGRGLSAMAYFPIRQGTQAEVARLDEQALSNGSAGGDEAGMAAAAAGAGAASLHCLRGPLQLCQRRLGPRVRRLGRRLRPRGEGAEPRPPPPLPRAPHLPLLEGAAADVEVVAVELVPRPPPPVVPLAQPLQVLEALAPSSREPLVVCRARLAAEGLRESLAAQQALQEAELLEQRPLERGRQAPQVSPPPRQVLVAGLSPQRGAAGPLPPSAARLAGLAQQDLECMCWAQAPWASEASADLARGVKPQEARWAMRALRLVSGAAGSLAGCQQLGRLQRVGLASGCLLEGVTLDNFGSAAGRATFKVQNVWPGDGMGCFVEELRKKVTDLRRRLQPKRGVGEAPGALLLSGMEQIRRYLARRGGADPYQSLGEFAATVVQCITSVWHGRHPQSETGGEQTRGELDHLGDLLIQRLKVIEQAAKDGHWQVEQQLELCDDLGVGLARQGEVHDAAIKHKWTHGLAESAAKPAGDLPIQRQNGSGGPSKWGGKQKSGKGKAGARSGKSQAGKDELNWLHAIVKGLNFHCNRSWIDEPVGPPSATQREARSNLLCEVRVCCAQCAGQIPGIDWESEPVSAAATYDGEEVRASNKVRGRIAGDALARGILKPIECHEIAEVQGRQIMEGMFGVKKGYHAKGAGPQRLAMNIIPSTFIQNTIEGDAPMLPRSDEGKGIILRSGEVLLWGVGDLKCCFYVRSLCDAWLKYMAISNLAKRVEVACDDERPGSYIGRGSARHGLKPSKWGNPCRICDGVPRLEEKGVGEAAELARGRYEIFGAPRGEQKAVLRETQTRSPGEAIDGARGTMSPPADFIRRLVSLTLATLKRGTVAQKWMQMLAGRWACSAVQFVELRVYGLMESPRRARLAVASPPAFRDEVVLWSLFDGVGGARRALDLLGLAPALFASAEIGPDAKRVTKYAWPDVLGKGNAQAFGDAEAIAARERAELRRWQDFNYRYAPCQLQGASCIEEPSGTRFQCAVVAWVMSHWAVKAGYLPQVPFFELVREVGCGAAFADSSVNMHKSELEDGVIVRQHKLEDESAASDPSIVIAERILPASWRLLRAWQNLKLPQRVLPSPEVMLAVVAAAARGWGRNDVAAVLVIGLAGFLRTSEMLTLRRWREDEMCLSEFVNQFKFYASFENSRCDGYITEKLSRAYDSGLVPVVWGGLKRADYEAVAPKDSFIHVDDFGSLELLAKHLMRLDKDDAAYNRYFEWKTRLHVVKGRDWALSRYCLLCHEVRKPLDKQQPTSPPLRSGWPAMAEMGQ
ncbi:unnamed protein product, partial [Prorocentrum cordatum]